MPGRPLPTLAAAHIPWTGKPWHSPSHLGGLGVPCPAPALPGTQNPSSLSTRKTCTVVPPSQGPWVPKAQRANSTSTASLQPCAFPCCRGSSTRRREGTDLPGGQEQHRTETRGNGSLRREVPFSLGSFVSGQMVARGSPALTTQQAGSFAPVHRN